MISSENLNIHERDTSRLTLFGDIYVFLIGCLSQITFKSPRLVFKPLYSKNPLYNLLARIYLTVLAYHFLPLAVGIPSLFNKVAICRSPNLLYRLSLYIF